MQRKQFTFYRSFYEGIETMKTYKEKAEAYRMLCEYAMDGIVPNIAPKKPCTETVFRVAKPILDRAWERSKAALRAQELRKLDDLL